MQRLMENAKKSARTKWGERVWNLLSERERSAELALEIISIISANSENEGWQKAGELCDVFIKEKVNV